MKRILIFGGTGAMGVYLVDILSKTGNYLIDVTSRSERKSFTPNVTYIKGNSRDNDFMQTLLLRQYDVIVDFMNYNLDEFADRCHLLLKSCTQYVWFSSCRVYADSPLPLTENSPRLLDVSSDAAFLSTNRYALRKARQEDLIKHSGYTNYTIVRPYITYSNERLQLGIYEKEQWLYRILRGRDLVINKNIIYKDTTLTYGRDVSAAVAKLINNQDAIGKIVQIASSENMKWKDILDIYLAIIKEKRNLSPKIYLSDNLKAIDELYEGGYNTIYDRVYNRHFNSQLINSLTKECDDVSYRNMKSGLRDCLSDFLDNNRSFLGIDWQFEAYQDILTNQMASEEEFVSEEERETYFRYRYIPSTEIELGNILTELVF